MAAVQPTPTPFLDWYGIWPSHRKEDTDGSVWSQEPSRWAGGTGEGFTVLVERPCAGQELKLNYRTAPDGWIKAELVHLPETPPKPIPAHEGFGLDEAETLNGDELSRTVRWKGQSSLAALRGRDVSVRLHLYKAKVFSVSY